MLSIRVSMNVSSEMLIVAVPLVIHCTAIGPLRCIRRLVYRYVHLALGTTPLVHAC